jgi:type III secretion protein Q
MAATEAGAAARTARDDALDALHVTLSFELGETTLTVGELRALAPGHVCPLGRRLEDAPVTVRANGEPVARGEIVLVDDCLAVRIVEVSADGRD